MILRGFFKLKKFGMLFKFFEISVCSLVVSQMTITFPQLNKVQQSRGINIILQTTEATNIILK